MREQILNKDADIICYIDSLSPKELKEMGHFQPKEFAHYISKQLPWIRKETYYLGCNLQREPSPKDIAKEVLKAPHSARFRAFYALKYPHKINPIIS